MVNLVVSWSGRCLEIPVCLLQEWRRSFSDSVLHLLGPRRHSADVLGDVRWSVLKSRSHSFMGHGPIVQRYCLKSTAGNSICHFLAATKLNVSAPLQVLASQ